MKSTRCLAYLYSVGLGWSGSSFDQEGSLLSVITKGDSLEKAGCAFVLVAVCEIEGGCGCLEC